MRLLVWKPEGAVGAQRDSTVGERIKEKGGASGPDSAAQEDQQPEASE